MYLFEPEEAGEGVGLRLTHLVSSYVLLLDWIPPHYGVRGIERSAYHVGWGLARSCGGKEKHIR